MNKYMYERDGSPYLTALEKVLYCNKSSHLLIYRFLPLFPK